MLYLIAELFDKSFGPLRLLSSHFFLGGIALVIGALGSYFALPRLAMKYLPRDRGRNFAVDAKAAQGKPTGAGIIFISLFVVLCCLVVPPNIKVFLLLLLTYACCIFGYLDDRATVSWSEYKKGLIDLVIAFLAACVICGLDEMIMWVPFSKTQFLVSPFLSIPISTIFIWASINTTNCTDGVDGLSGTLVAIAFASLGSLHYFALSHIDISRYLLLPHFPIGANWGVVTAASVGTLGGYLWYNAHPSSMLMGDAGSRALGFLLGVLVMESGNPFLIFITSGVLLINGGTGLVKVALLRFAKIAIFRNIRFPLHDHVRHNRGWSNTQVLVRFSLIQFLMTFVFLVLVLKLR